MLPHLKFPPGEQRKFLEFVFDKSGLQADGLAKIVKVSPRTIRDWKRERYNITQEATHVFAETFSILLPNNENKLIENWQELKSKASRIGGKARILKYGAPGTPEGRRKGGLNSINSPKIINSRFKFKKVIYKPKASEELAELIGIMIGDGGITKLQAQVSLHLIDDLAYSEYVAALFEKLFKIKPAVYKYERRTTIEVVASSKELVEFLNSLGLPIGDKIRQQIDIPLWIKENQNFANACIRGIFDTDGSIYQDKHIIKNRCYDSPNIAIVSASPKLLSSINTILTNQGLNPTNSSYRSIRLRRTKQVAFYFDKIGSSNLKNQLRYKRFTNMEGYRSGYNGSASKAAV